MVTNTTRLLSTKRVGKGHITCLDGIRCAVLLRAAVPREHMESSFCRFISMSWVLLSHVFSGMPIKLPTDNFYELRTTVSRTGCMRL